MKYVSLRNFERGLDARKAALGYTGFHFVRPNSGVARTPAKRALLRSLHEAARHAGRKPRFEANF